LIKKGVNVVKKIINTPPAKCVITVLFNMGSNQVPMVDIISQGADIISSGTKFANNMFSSKPQKDILKNTTKFDFMNKFNWMNELIKIRKAID
jgi:hypothetical protein